MVVMVLRAELTHIMVDIADRKLRFDFSHAHRFKQQKRRRTGGVLGECLVDTNADIPADLQLPINKMVTQDFVS
ncbi:hypothetical protein ES703_105507 [subsurface metagenome]